MQTSAATSRCCPGCEASTEDLRFVVHGFPIWQCQICGLGRTDASAFDPGQYYTESYFSGAHADGYADYLGSEPVLRRQFAREVRFVRKFMPGGRLLEVGCAYGFFLQEARQAFDVTGIELSEDAAQHARDRGLKVISGIADDHVLKQAGILDVIVLLDVIEHLPDPRETVERLAAHLRPGGALVVTTGDFKSLSARLFGKHWRLMTPPQHLWFFTPASIAGIASHAGLRIESLDHPWKVVPLSLISFQLSRILGLRPARQGVASGFGIPVNLFDAMRVVMRK